MIVYEAKLVCYVCQTRAPYEHAKMPAGWFKWDRYHACPEHAPALQAFSDAYSARCKEKHRIWVELHRYPLPLLTPRPVLPVTKVVDLTYGLHASCSWCGELFDKHYPMIRIPSPRRELEKAGWAVRPQWIGKQRIPAIVCPVCIPEVKERCAALQAAWEAENVDRLSASEAQGRAYAAQVEALGPRPEVPGLRKV